METRSSKNKPLTEDEIQILHDQLAKKEQRLKDREEAIRLKDLENQDRYRSLQMREKEMIEREKDQISQFQAAQKELASREPNLENDAGREEASNTNFPRASAEPGIENLLGLLLKDFDYLKKEVTDLRSSIRSHQEPRSLPVPHGNNGSNNNPPSYENVALPSPHLQFKDVLESVPTFTGNNIPVLKFTRACKRVKEMFSPTLETTIVRLLRNKLKDQAYTAMEDDPSVTVTEFTERLKTLFGSAKSLNQYRGELGNICKGRSEHVIDYISRVKDLHSAIIDAETSNSGESPTQPYINGLQNETLECFVTGLPPNFRLRLRLEGYDSLSSAFTAAIRIEKEMERDRVRFRDPRTETQQPPSAKVNTAQRDKPPCDHCSKPGHDSENCWSKYPDKRPARNETRPKPSSNPPRGGTRPICTYCNRPGHEAKDCFTKQRDEQRRDAPSTSGNGQQRSTDTGASRTEQPAERPVHTAAQDVCEQQTSD